MDGHYAVTHGVSCACFEMNYVMNVVNVVWLTFDIGALGTPPAVCDPGSGRRALRPTFVGAPPFLLTLGKFVDVGLVLGIAAADPLDAGAPFNVGRVGLALCNISIGCILSCLESRFLKALGAEVPVVVRGGGGAKGGSATSVSCGTGDTGDGV